MFSKAFNSWVLKTKDCLTKGKSGIMCFSSLAASAPIWQFTGLTPCEAFNEVLTKSFERESKQCVDNIRNSWKEINDLGEISKCFKCSLTD